MILTNIDREPVILDYKMIKEVHRRGQVTVITTHMGDKLTVVEPPAEIVGKAIKEREQNERL